MANNIRPYQISNQYSKTEKYAFLFANNEKRYNRWGKIRQQIIEEKLDGKISPTWILMSIIGMAAAIGFGIYAAFNAKLALAGIIDPKNEGVIPTYVLSIIGLSISSIGLLLGHEIHEKFKSTERDSITGSISISSSLWALIPAALVYIGFQFLLVHTAGSGIEDTDAGLLNLAWVVAGIALLELLVGAFILNKAIAYLSLLAVSLFLVFFMYRMNRSANLTNNNYRRYLSILDTYNGKIDREGNNFIRRAIGYYVGVQEKQEDKEKDQDDSKDDVMPITESQPKPIVPNDGNGAASELNIRNNHHEDLEAFIDDNIDDDLTM